MPSRPFIFSASIISLFIISSLLFMLHNPETIKNDIASGELQYTYNCGWVNWGHAIPDGVKNLINEIISIDTIQGQKIVSYSQNMKSDFLGDTKIVIELSRTYSFKTSLPINKREKIAYTIFKETSESFEKMQGSFPFYLEQGSKTSSFRDGDLTGNKIAFYSALRGYSKEYIEKISQPVPTSESLKLLEEGKIGKNKQWTPNYYICEGEYPKELNKIQMDTTSLDNELFFMNEKKRIYLIKNRK